VKELNKLIFVFLFIILAIHLSTIKVIREMHKEEVKYTKQLIEIHKERNRVIIDNIDKRNKE